MPNTNDSADSLEQFPSNTSKTVKMRWEEDPENQGFIFLYWDGIVWKRVKKSLFAKHLSQLCQISNMDQVKRKFTEVEIAIGKSLAIRWLSQRNLLVDRIEEKLKAFQLSHNAIQETISYCKEIGVIDELQQLEDFICSHIRKGHGPIWILTKLRHLPSINVTQLKTIFEKFEPLQEEVIQHLIRKRCRTKPLVNKEKQKMISFFLRKGFAYSLVAKCIETY